MTGVYDVEQRQDERSGTDHPPGLDLGVTLIDTADSYGPFTNELLVGRAVAGNPHAVLSTKVGLVGRSDGQQLRNARPDHIVSAADASLRRLRAERIDPTRCTLLTPMCRWRTPGKPWPGWSPPARSGRWGS